MSVTSTKGKLEVLKRHYQQLGTCSVDTAFDGIVGRRKWIRKCVSFLTFQ